METRFSLSLGSLFVRDNYHAPYERMGEHIHQNPYICIVLDGEYSETVGSRLMSLQQGAILGHPAGDRHANEFSKFGGRCLNIEPTGVWNENETWMLCLQDRVSGRFAAAPSGLARLRYELEAADTVRPLGLAAALFDLIDSAFPNSHDVGVPGWLRRVRDRLHAEPTGCPGLAELASEAGVHPSHLARAFRRWQGRSIGAYARGLRVEAALAILADGETELVDIALACGFNDQAHFSRVIKQVTGMTPRTYKNARSAQEHKIMHC